MRTRDAADAQGHDGREERRAAAPSRRSEALALALVLLGAGAAVIAVFHDRIGSLELGKDGVKIDLDPAAQTRGRRARRAARRGRRAAAKAYGRGLDRYLRAVASRPEPGRCGPDPARQPPCSAPAQAAALADRIADELV